MALLSQEYFLALFHLQQKNKLSFEVLSEALRQLREGEEDPYRLFQRLFELSPKNFEMLQRTRCSSFEWKNFLQDLNQKGLLSPEEAERYLGVVVPESAPPSFFLDSPFFALGLLIGVLTLGAIAFLIFVFVFALRPSEALVSPLPATHTVALTSSSVATTASIPPPIEKKSPLTDPLPLTLSSNMPSVINVMPPFDEGERLFQEAKALEEKGEQAQAYELFEKVLQRDPHHWESCLHLARISVLKEEYETALVLFQKVKTLQKSARIFLDEAFVHYLLNQFEEGLACIEEALALGELSAEAFKLKGRFFLAGGQAQEALDAFKRLLNWKKRIPIFEYFGQKP